MATFDFTKGGTTGLADTQKHKHVVLENEIDFAHADYAGVVGSSVVQMLNVPAGFLMTRCIVNVKTAAGGVVTFTVGDGAAAAGWILVVDGNVAGVTLSNLDLSEAAPPTYDDANMGLGGKYYAAADTIDIVPSDVMLAAVVKIFAEGFMVS